MRAERLAALLRTYETVDADDEPVVLFAGSAEDMAARLIAQGVRVYDPAQYLTGVSDEECLEDDIAHVAARHPGVRVGDDAGGLRAALEHIRDLCDMSLEDMRRIHGSEQRVLFALIPAEAEFALAAQPAPPALTLDEVQHGIRKVKMWPGLWEGEGMGLRDFRGYRLTIEWGQPDAEGWWTPTFTSHNDEPLPIDRERLARALRAWDRYWTETSAPKAAAAIAQAYEEEDAYEADEREEQA